MVLGMRGRGGNRCNAHSHMTTGDPFAWGRTRTCNHMANLRHSAIDYFTLQKNSDHPCFRRPSRLRPPKIDQNKKQLGGYYYSDTSYLQDRQEVCWSSDWRQKQHAITLTTPEHQQNAHQNTNKITTRQVDKTHGSSASIEHAHVSRRDGSVVSHKGACEQQYVCGGGGLHRTGF